MIRVHLAPAAAIIDGVQANRKRKTTHDQTAFLFLGDAGRRNKTTRIFSCDLLRQAFESFLVWERLGDLIRESMQSSWGRFGVANPIESQSHFRARSNGRDIPPRSDPSMRSRPQSFVSKCESGERRVNVIELMAFCRAYRTGIVQVLTSLKRP